MRYWLFAAIALGLWRAPATAQPLDIENVSFRQELDSRVIVTYDLLGDPDKEYTVILSIFIPASRKKVPVSLRSLTGAVGKAIKPGRGLEIVWDLRRDYPDGLEGDGFRFIVDAYLQQKKSSKLPWILAGLVAAGGAAFLVTTGGQPAATPDLPAPPVLPANR